MALTLTEQWVSHTKLAGQSTFEIPAGQWLNLRFGTVQSQTDELLQQVPAGKHWRVSVVVDIEETNA